MIKKRLIIIFAALCVMLSLSVNTALALTDAEYKQMMRNSDFARADKALNNAWSNAKKSLSAYDFETLKREQREWISKGRDNEASELIIGSSLSKIQAYTIVTKARANYISNFASGQDIQTSSVLVAAKKTTTQKTNVPASGGMRNLLNEFAGAVQNRNLEKVNSLIKEGVDVNDAIYILAR